ncbi:DNA polymerase II [Salmonella enterica subsp. enterica]|nr:DNA polymerase II [Salmonella enterica subsp. enterica]
MAGELDAQLVYRKRLRRPLHEYQRNIPPHVRAARLADEQNLKQGRPAQYQNRGAINMSGLLTARAPGLPAVAAGLRTLSYPPATTRGGRNSSFVEDNFATLLTGQLGLF